jgi:uncharacterized membrane protein (DUF4010 family)
MVDLAFVAAYVVHPPVLPGWAWQLDQDGSIPEVYGYAKLGAAALLLWLLGRHHASRLALGWAAAVAVVVLDDAGRLHERGGRLAAWAVHPGPALGLRPEDQGEVVVLGALALLAALPLWHQHRRADPWSRSVSRALAPPLVLLGAAAAGLDVVHRVMAATTGRAGVVLEDGTELLLQSLVLASTMAVVTAEARSRLVAPLVPDRRWSCGPARLPVPPSGPGRGPNAA